MADEPRPDRTRRYAGLLALGATILLYRTVTMVVEGALAILTAWVGALTVLELVIDLVTLVAALRWASSRAAAHGAVALRWGAAATILHALRVLIFALGRAPAWLNFDVRPAHRAAHAARWTWGQVYFASTLSVLGVIGVLVIWWIRRARAARRAGLASRPRERAER